jgi:hypothetical protein
MRKINLAATPDFAIQIVAQVPFRLSRYRRLQHHLQHQFPVTDLCSLRHQAVALGRKQQFRFEGLFRQAFGGDAQSFGLLGEQFRFVVGLYIGKVIAAEP